jgi:hypothetical protein
MMAKCTLGSCLVATGSFFVDPNNTFSSKCRSIAFVDKIFKAVDPLLDLAGVIAEAQGASDETLKGIGRGRSFAKITRDGMALLNIVQGVIPTFVAQAKTCGNLFVDIFSCSTAPVAFVKAGPLKEGACGGVSTTATLSTSTVQPACKSNEQAMTRAEKIVAFFEHLGKGIASGCYIIAFGVCRPIANWEKHISKNIDPTASEIGKAFPTVMMINHFAAVVGHGSAMIYQTLAYDRTIEGLTEKSTREAIDTAYIQKMVENGVGLGEKVLEGALDVMRCVGYAAPPAVRLPLTFGVGFFCLTKEWIKKP